MIKVLDKTFSILETVIIASPRPVRISELGAELQINSATCARILKELTDAGYLIKVSRGEGYSAGPRALALAQQVSYREKLLRAARPILRKCAEQQQASILLAERRGCVRYILLHINRCEKLDIHLKELAFHDLLLTATGIVLTAYAPAAEQQKILQFYRDTPAPLIPPDRAALEAIRCNGGAVFDKRSAGQGIVAFPIFENHKFLATIGGSIAAGDFTASRRKEFAAAVQSAARAISQAISNITTIG